MKLAIYGRVYKKEYQKQLQNLFDFLHQNEISFLVEESFLIQCKQADIKIKETDSFDCYDILKQYEVDYMISIFGKRKYGRISKSARKLT